MSRTFSPAQLFLLIFAAGITGTTSCMLAKKTPSHVSDSDEVPNKRTRWGKPPTERDDVETSIFTALSGRAISMTKEYPGKMAQKGPSLELACADVKHLADIFTLKDESFACYNGLLFSICPEEKYLFFKEDDGTIKELISVTCVSKEAHPLTKKDPAAPYTVSSAIHSTPLTHEDLLLLPVSNNPSAGPLLSFSINERGECFESVVIEKFEPRYAEDATFEFDEEEATTTCAQSDLMLNPHVWPWEEQIRVRFQPGSHDATKYWDEYTRIQATPSSSASTTPE